MDDGICGQRGACSGGRFGNIKKGQPALRTFNALTPRIFISSGPQTLIALSVFMRINLIPCIYVFF